MTEKKYIRKLIEDKVWKNNKGELIPISELEDSHMDNLLNILRDPNSKILGGDIDIKKQYSILFSKEKEERDHRRENTFISPDYKGLTDEEKIEKFIKKNKNISILSSSDTFFSDYSNERFKKLKKYFLAIIDKDEEINSFNPPDELDIIGRHVIIKRSPDIISIPISAIYKIEEDNHAKKLSLVYIFKNGTQKPASEILPDDIIKDIKRENIPYVPDASFEPSCEKREMSFKIFERETPSNSIEVSVESFSKIDGMIDAMIDFELGYLSPDDDISKFKIELIQR